LARCPNRRIFAASSELRTISATLERGRIQLIRLRPWLFATTFSLGFASCFLNPGPELPTSDEASDGGTGGLGGSPNGGAAGTSASGSGGAATGGTSAGGTAGTSAGGTSSIDAGNDADAGPGEGGAGGENAEDAGPDADDAGG
jgi:hypothetical protein